MDSSWTLPRMDDQPALPRCRLDNTPAPEHRRRARLISMSGYRPASPVLYRLWNVGLGLTLLLLTLPVWVLITAALALTQGPRNIFYRGERIGMDGRPFRIIKFKTLRPEAALLTRDQVLPPNSQMETLLGRPLRDTRLDELPQLLNVLSGNMNMFGPRPVRPAIAAACRQTVPNYDARFAVKPGLIGYTQALMPHSADKAIRARVNAVLCRRRVNLPQELLFITITGLAVLAWTGRVGFRTAAAALHLERFGWKGGCRPYQGHARIEAPELSTVTMRLLHIDHDNLRVESAQPLPLGDGPYTLALHRGYRFRSRGKTARCTAVVTASEAAGGENGGITYTMRYSTASPLQKYLIERHFVGSVLVA